MIDKHLRFEYKFFMSSKSLSKFINIVLNVYIVGACISLLGGLILAGMGYFLISSDSETIQKFFNNELSPNFINWMSDKGKSFFLITGIWAVFISTINVIIFKESKKIIKLVNDGKFISSESVILFGKISRYFVILFIFSCFSSVYYHWLNPAGDLVMDIKTIKDFTKISFFDFIVPKFDGAVCIYIAGFLLLIKKLIHELELTV